MAPFSLWCSPTPGDPGFYLFLYLIHLLLSRRNRFPFTVYLQVTQPSSMFRSLLLHSVASSFSYFSVRLSDSASPDRLAHEFTWMASE